MSNEELNDLEAQNLRTVYQELCTSYREIDSFRAKLLGFLPLVFLLLNDAITDKTKWESAMPFLQPIGLFGIAITLGLFAYELYGIKKCHCLIEFGKDIEGEGGMGIEGQFTKRPRGIAKDLINEPFAAGIIYPAVLAAWTYIVSVGSSCGENTPKWPAIVIFAAGFVLTLSYSINLGKKDKNDICRTTK